MAESTNVTKSVVTVLFLGFINRNMGWEGRSFNMVQKQKLLSSASGQIYRHLKIITRFKRAEKVKNPFHPDCTVYFCEIQQIVMCHKIDHIILPLNIFISVNIIVCSINVILIE